MTIDVEIDLFATVMSYVFTAMTVALFIIGIRAVKVHKAPLYFRLIVYAIGCYAMENVCDFIITLCNPDGGNIGQVSLICCQMSYYLFLVSANFGQMDGLVDDRTSSSRKASLIAMLFPVVVTVVSVYALLTVLIDMSVLIIIELFAQTVPMAIGGYFALKHLLLPMDELGIKKVTKPINLTMVVALSAELIYMVSALYALEGFYVLVSVSGIVAELSLVFLLIFTVKGAKKWKTLI